MNMSTARCLKSLVNDPAGWQPSEIWEVELRNIYLILAKQRQDPGM